MAVRRLEHYNILTQKLDETVRFYVSMLGMRAALPPGMPEGRGMWIYDGTDTPVVHLQAMDPDDPDKLLDQVKARLGSLAGSLDPESLKGTGALEHVAFECDEYEEFVERFDKAGLPTRYNEVPQIELRQIFLNDPNGVTIELNFRAN